MPIQIDMKKCTNCNTYYAKYLMPSNLCPTCIAAGVVEAVETKVEEPVGETTQNEGEEDGVTS
jgi:hypothetical protein